MAEQAQMATLTAERVYLYLHEEIKARQALQTRVDVLEHFIRMQFSGHFAGETTPESVGVDDTLKPIPIVFGEPQERLNERTGEWETARNGR